MKTIFNIMPDFLRNPDRFFMSIRDNKNVAGKALTLGLAAFLFLLAYGFTLGLTKSYQQALSSAVKMPVLFLSTTAFCLPALYFFSLALLRTPLRMVQVLAIILSGIAVTAFLLLGLAPITLFFVLTSTDYPFFQLLAVGFVGISALIGISFLWRGMLMMETTREESMKPLGRRILGLWMILFGFVGTQMTWRLSPFIGRPEDPFYIVKPSRDNFYVDVLHAVSQVLNIPTVSLNLDTPLMMAGLCLLGAVLVYLSISALLGTLRKKAAPDLEKGSVDPKAKAVEP